MEQASSNSTVGLINGSYYRAERVDDEIMVTTRNPQQFCECFLPMYGAAHINRLTVLTFDRDLACKEIMVEYDSNNGENGWQQFTPGKLKCNDETKNRLKALFV